MNTKLLELLSGEKPKTWGALTDRVMQIIDEEPKRLWMKDYFADGLPEGHVALPECGTVGCFIGWGSLLTGKVDSDLASAFIWSDAKFFWPLSKICYRTYLSSQSGTREYADEVLAKLRAVRDEYREEMDRTAI